MEVIEGGEDGEDCIAVGGMLMTEVMVMKRGISTSFSTFCSLMSFCLSRLGSPPGAKGSGLLPPGSS